MASKPVEITWTGDVDDIPRIAPVMRAASRPGGSVIWWAEPDMLGSADLLVTRELSTDAPIRLRPGDRLRSEGGELSRVVPPKRKGAVRAQS